MSDDVKAQGDNNEIESLNERVLDASEATIEELERVSGGEEVADLFGSGGTCDTFKGSCGGFTGHCGTF